MRIDIEHVRKIQEERLRINKLKLEEIEWYENGKRVEVDPKDAEDFKFTGLCNTDFVTMNFFENTSL